MSELLDARGVAIEAGDSVIYGFGVSRSVAMAEGVVLQAEANLTGTPSVTASGRVRVRVIRRSYSDGVKPVVDVAADRLVVLKFWREGHQPYLPVSPLPTQDDERYEKLRHQLPRQEAALWELVQGGPLPEWALTHPNFGGDEDVAREWLTAKRRRELWETQCELTDVIKRLGHD